MLPVIKLYMLICEGSEHGSESALWKKTITTWPSVPDPGALIMINGDSGWNAYVKNVYWSDDGTVTVDLRALIVDPDMRTQESLTPSSAHWNYVSTWYTNSEGHRPEPGLIEAGWHIS